MGLHFDHIPLDPLVVSKMTIDSMSDHCICTLDLNGLIISANPGSKKIMGYSEDELLKTHFARFYRMEDIENKIPEHDFKLVGLQDRFTCESWKCRKDGSLFWAHLTLCKLTDSHGPFAYALVIRDLTKKKESEENLRTSQSMALKALKLKTQFIADISHEIRTPLGAILGFTEFLLKDDISAENRRHYLEIILKNGRHLHHLLNDILDLSKIEAGRIEIQMREFNLNQLITEVIELFHAECAQKNVTLQYNPNKLDLGHITTDPNRLQQVLINIIGNAVKFTDKGSISVNVEKEEKSNQIKIYIKDTGFGLTKDEASRLFHPYVQADRCHKRAIKGTGLGLILSRKIAEALGGDVELVQSELGMGSTFGISFIDYLSLPTPLRQKSSAPKAKSLNSKSILVIDDSIDNLEIIKLFLNSYGGETDLANDAQEALSKMQSKNYDVILMDIEMPFMNGFQLMEKLHSLNVHTPVIALTAHAMPEDRKKTKEAGFFDHVTKPIDFDYLVSTIENVETV